MDSAIYEGIVRHRRFKPVCHEFRYGLTLMYLDLEELDEVFRGRWFWSARRPAPARFRRDDHLGPPDQPLDCSVRDLVEKRTGRRPDGPIRLLTQLRYFGYLMNPVCFFFCFDPSGQRVEAIIAEVNNTPWGERHCYVLDAACVSQMPPGQPCLQFRHAKEFHVSPFLGMDLEYAWRLTEPGPSLQVHIDVLHHGTTLFDSELALRRREITGRELTRVWARYPWMTGKITAAIYWQALRLWLRKIPFYPHPRHAAEQEVKV